MAVLAGAPVVDTFNATELAKSQEGRTLDSLTHRKVTKESLEEEWRVFEMMSRAAENGVHIRRG